MRSNFGCLSRHAARSCCAESFIGVSGFLISCATWRAISAQALIFFERMSSVRSSKTATAPWARPSESTSRVPTNRIVLASPPSSGPPVSNSWTTESRRPRSTGSTAAMTAPNAGPPSTSRGMRPIASGASTPRIRLAASFTVAMRPAASKLTTPDATWRMMASMYSRRSRSRASDSASLPDISLNERTRAPISAGAFVWMRCPRRPAPMSAAPADSSESGPVRRFARTTAAAIAPANTSRQKK